MIYAGIGSRKTPEDTLKLMYFIGQKRARLDHILRSGGADGADKAFENGCRGMFGQMAIYRPHHATAAALAHAEKFHPAWSNCNDYVKKLHARNSLIILGLDLQHPVDEVICWTPDGQASGGTGQALRIAQAYSIKIINLYFMFNVSYCMKTYVYS